MKTGASRYLSYRILLLFGALALLCLALLTALAMLCIGDGRGWLLPGLGLGLGLLLLALGWFRVLRPWRETARIIRLFATGYTVQGVYNLPHPISPETELAFRKLEEMFQDNETIRDSKRQAQYLALQNQINPHFLYNTLEAIRSEALTAGLPNIARMTEALARFFRYTITNVENLVTLEDELQNIQTYALIQQYRFGDRLGLHVLWDDDEDREALGRCRLPKLTLQPIVENAIFHGIERKVGPGQVNVKVEATEKRLLLTISDDGLGMDQARLAEINRRLSAPSPTHVAADNRGGGIAIVNVNNRIKLLFGEEYGVNLHSTEGVGTDVEISIPLQLGSAGP